MATHSSILAWRYPMDRGAWKAAVYSIHRVDVFFLSRFSHIGHFRVLSRVPCDVQQVLIVYLFCL